MKDLPRKKAVEKLEKEDLYLEEYTIEDEEKFFKKAARKIKRMFKTEKVKKPKYKKIKD